MRERSQGARRGPISWAGGEAGYKKDKEWGYGTRPHAWALDELGSMKTLCPFALVSVI